jgi:hypothetical protein
MGDNADPSRYSLARRLDERSSCFVSNPHSTDLLYSRELKQSETRQSSQLLLWLRLALFHLAGPRQIAKRLQGFQGSHSD